MSQDNYNFKINVGASLVINMTWTDEDNQPIDLTGWTGSLTSTALAISIPLTLTSSGGITGAHIDTTLWKAGSYDYSLQLIDGDGHISTILQGKICVHNVPIW